MKTYNNYYSIQQRLENQRHWMNLLCMGKKRLDKYIENNPNDEQSIKAKSIIEVAK